MERGRGDINNRFRKDIERYLRVPFSPLLLRLFSLLYENCFRFYFVRVIFTLVEEFKLANVIILRANKTTGKLRIHSHFKIN